MLQEVLSKAKAANKTQSVLLELLKHGPEVIPRMINEEADFHATNKQNATNNLLY